MLLFITFLHHHARHVWWIPGGDSTVIKNCFSIIRLYLQALNPWWVVASFAVTALAWMILKKQGYRNFPMLCFTLLYLCLVYTSTVLSRDIDPRRGHAMMPFWSYALWMRSNSDLLLAYLVLHILMLLPIGVSLSALWQDWRPIVLLGFSFSCLIEISQLLTKRGQCDIDDVINNTLGVVLGIGLYRLGKHLIDNAKC